MDFKKISEIIRSTETRHRDYVIERVLNNEEIQLTPNEKFINEVRDHLSTVVNRSEFINNKKFREPNLFTIEKTCDCKVILQKEKEFDKSMRTLYFMYRQDTNFNVMDILTDEYITTLNTPIMCEVCGELEYDCDCGEDD